MDEVQILKELFKAFSEKKMVLIRTNNGEVNIGSIQSCDGNIVLLNEKNINVSTISEVIDYDSQITGNEMNNTEKYKTYEKQDLDKYVGYNIQVSFKSNETIEIIEGLLFAIDSNRLIVLTSSNKSVVLIEEIVDIAPIQETYGDEQVSREGISVNGISNFENCILSGNREEFEEYISEPDRLRSEGYSDKEIKKIIAASKLELPWEDNAQNARYYQARRIFMLEGNRFGLAKRLFLSVIEDDTIKGKNKTRSISTLIEICEKESAKQLVTLLDTRFDNICSNNSLRQKMVKALVNVGEYERAKQLIALDANPIGLNQALLVLSFAEQYNNHNGFVWFDIDAFSDDVEYEELLYFTQIPDYTAIVSLLRLYERKNAWSTFFKLLDFCMPYAKYENDIVEIVKKSLLKADYEFQAKYIPKFPLLWLNNTLSKIIAERFVVDETSDLCLKNMFGHCVHSSKYESPNSLEESIITANYQLFDVFRSNDSIMTSFGYSSEDISRIRSCDIDQLRYGNKPIIEKLLYIEGNRGHVPESTASYDFLKNPLAVCEQLFPLLINSNRGELIYELYNYAPIIREQLLPLKQLYLKALLLIGQREEWWLQIKDNWFEINLDAQMREELMAYAIDSNNYELVMAVKLFNSLDSFNELESAIIYGNVAQFRTLITDADYLTGNGYSTEEILLIQELAKQKIDFSVNNYLSIANRIFTFQKNKHRMAEFFYRLALVEHEKIAAMGLFSIYSAENNAEKLCDLVEKYTELCENRDNICIYLKSLYELGRYEDYYNCWFLKKDYISSIPIELVSVLIAKQHPVSEIDKIILNPILNTDDIESSKECIIHLLSCEANSVRADFITKLYNKHFENFEYDDVVLIKKAITDSAIDVISQPSGNGILALIKDEDKCNLLYDWCEYLFNGSALVVNCFEIIRKIIAVYGDQTDIFDNFISALVQKARDSHIEIPSDFQHYLYPSFKDDSDKLKWLEKIIDYNGKIDEATFDTCYKLSFELNNYSALHNILCSKEIDYSSKCITSSYELLNKYIDSCADVTIVTEMIDAVLHYTKGVYLTAEQLNLLTKSFEYIGSSKWLAMAQYVLNDNSQHVQLEQICNGDSSDKDYSLFEILEMILENDFIQNTDRFLQYWGKYIKTEDDDFVALDEVKDYYNTPEKWTSSGLEALAKHVFIHPKNLFYWKLLFSYFSDKNLKAKSNVLCHLSLIERRWLIPTLDCSSDNGFKNHAVYALCLIFENMTSTIYLKNRTHIEEVIDSHKDWFSNTRTAIKLISAIRNTSDKEFEHDAWTNLVGLALKIAITADIEKWFYNEFDLSNDHGLGFITLQLLCSLLLKNSNDKELIMLAKETLTACNRNIPYKECVLDTIIADNTQSNEVKNTLYRIVLANTGSNLNENVLLEFYLSSVVNSDVDNAIDFFSFLIAYYPDNSVISKIYTYLLSIPRTNDDVVKEIYCSLFNGLKYISDYTKVKKSINELFFAETYLKSHSIEVPSVYNYCVNTLTINHVKELQHKRQIIKSLDNTFNVDIYPDLANIFVKCLFMKKWDDFILYKVDDQYLNDIIKSDAIIGNFLRYKCFEVLRSAVLCLLDSDDDFERVVDRSLALFKATGNLINSRKKLLAIKDYSSEQRNVAKKVFSLRIGSEFLRKAGLIGKAILRIENSAFVSDLIGLLFPYEIMTIFNNRCYDVLKSLPDEVANELCQSYMTYLVDHNSVFSEYLSNSDSETGQIDKELIIQTPEEGNEKCLNSRKRYEQLKYQYEKRGAKDLRNKYEFAKLNYLFYSVVYQSPRDIERLQPMARDYLHILSWLFNAKSVFEIRNYLWKLSEELQYPAYIWLLTLLNQYPSAYKLINDIEEKERQHDLLLNLYLCIRLLTLTTEDETIRNELKDRLSYDPSFFVYKHVPRGTSEISIYVEKMKALRMVMKDYHQLLIEKSSSAALPDFDDERYNLYLDYYQSKLPVIVQNSTELQSGDSYIISRDKEPVTVDNNDDLLNLDYVSELLARTQQYEELDINTANANKDLYIYANKLKKLLDSEGFPRGNDDIENARHYIRWILLLSIENSGYTREQFNQLLYYISDGDQFTKIEWEKILACIYLYFDNIESLQQLTRIAENDIKYLKNVGMISNRNIKLLRSADKEEWTSIIAVVSDIASIDSVKMPEKQQINILEKCKRTLLSNTADSKSSVFDRVNNKLLQLVIQRTTSLMHTPELEIKVIGENMDKTQTIIWDSSNKKGTLYSIISNVGGANCCQVVVTSYVNMNRIRSSNIATIYPGERIPFVQSFTEVDLVEGRVTWFLEVSYYDPNKNEMVSVKKESVAIVTYGEAALRFGTISTGHPAKGKDFIGRRRELALLKSHYFDEETIPSMLIRGLKRSGKSSIMIQFYDECKRRGQFIVALVDGQSTGSNIRIAFVDKVLESLRINYRSHKEYGTIIRDQFDAFCEKWKDCMNDENWIGLLDTFYYELRVLFGKKILVMLDEMEAVFYNHRFESIDQEEITYSALRALIQNPLNYVSFIFCGSDKLLTSCLEKRRESQMFQTLHYLEVGHMNYADIQQLFKMQTDKYDIIYTVDAVDAIWQFTSGMIWYAKLIGYLIINNIFANDLTIRNEVNRYDVTTAVQMLINGEIGTDKYDLVDASLDNRRSAIVHAMAEIMPDYNAEVSIDDILMSVSQMRQQGYINPRTGETIPDMDKTGLLDDLEFLEKMQFIDSNESKTKYMFTSELYRLFFRKEKKLHLFEERVGE